MNVFHLDLFYDPITRFIRNSAWCAWVIALIFLASGVGEPHSLTSGRYPSLSERSFWWDVFVWALTGGAALITGITQIWYDGRGRPFQQLGQWVMAIALTILGWRMGVMVLTRGQIFAPDITLVGLGLVPIAQLVHCFASWSPDPYDESVDSGSDPHY